MALRLLIRPQNDLLTNLRDTTLPADEDAVGVGRCVAGASAETKFGDMSRNKEVDHTRFQLLVRKERGRWKVYRAEGVD